MIGSPRFAPHLAPAICLSTLCLLLTGPILAQDNSAFIDHAAHIGVYRLVATTFPEVAQATGAVWSPNIHHVGMTSDGDWLAWSGYQRPASTLYFSDFDGSSVSSVALDPALGDPWEFAVGGRQAVFVAGGGTSLWAADPSGAGLLFKATSEIQRIRSLEVTADGQWLYFVSDMGPNANDIYQMPVALGTPQRIVDDADIPCPAVEHCKSVWTVASIRISADGGMLAALISGYFVEDPTTQRVVGVDHDEIVLLSGSGYRYLTDNLPFGTVLSAASLSSDGSTIVYHAQVFDELLTNGVRRWVASPTGGAGRVTLLTPQDFNLSEPGLNGNGSLAFLDLSLIAETESGSAYALFPSWGRPIKLAATNNLTISQDGHRIAFSIANEAFYVGMLDDPQGLSRSPIAIRDIQIEPQTAETFVLAVTTNGPVSRMSVDVVQDGMIVVDPDSLPVQCTHGLHDDANPPDAVAGDGIFTSHCTSMSAGPLTLRLGLATEHQGWVVVQDILVG